MKFLHFSIHTIVLFYTLSSVWSTNEHEAVVVESGSNHYSRSLRKRTSTRQNICVATTHKTFKVRNVSKSKVDTLLKEKDGMKGTCSEVCNNLCDTKGVKKVTSDICECKRSSKCGKDKIHNASGNCIPMRRSQPAHQSEDEEPPLLPAGCLATSCTINSNCIEDDNGVAECVCMKQYAFNDNGQCVPIQCTKINIKCNGEYEICSINNNDDKEPTCECLPGYEKTLDEGLCAPVLFPGCAAIICVTNTVCVEGSDGQAECLCAEGYELDVDTGLCVPVECKKQKIVCKDLEICTLSSDGTVGCECGPGTITSDGECYENPCNLVDCQQNHVCIITDEGGICVEDKCALTRCKENTECINTEDGAICSCLNGFTDIIPGPCIPTCDSVRCGSNSECVVSPENIAQCLCIDGYVPESILPDSDDFCTKSDVNMPEDRPGCAAVTCPTNTECVENSDGAGECIEVLPPGCALILCVPNTICVEAANDAGAECICAKGYETNDDTGLCVPVECKKQEIVCKGLEICTLSSDGTVGCECGPGSITTSDGDCVENPCNLMDCQENNVCIITDVGEGMCVEDKCALVRCKENTECINTEDGAECKCLLGFIDTPDSGCITSCAVVRCGFNTECVVSPEGNAECVCADGYVPGSDGFCTKTEEIMTGDRLGCAAVTCPTNTECIENSDGAGECVEVLPPGCALILCVPNTICVEAANDVGAECKCAKGYETNDDNGLCLPVECQEQDVVCKDPLVCILESDGTTASCGCFPGFDLTPDGECTIVDSAACAAVSCPINTVCIDEGDGSASCPCADGFEFNEDGQCVQIK